MVPAAQGGPKTPIDLVINETVAAVSGYTRAQLEFIRKD